MSLPEDAVSAELLHVYDTQLRGDSEMRTMTDVQSIGPVWVGEIGAGESGFVSYASLAGLDGDRLDALIDEVIAHFRDETKVNAFEWKTRGHDAPADLTNRLVARGFVAEEEETVMLGLADGVADGISDDALPAGVTIRTVGSGDASLEDDVRAALDLQAEIFGHGAGTVEDHVRRLAERPGNESFWLATADGEVVSAGRITIVDGTDLAGIWGGVTHPNWRRRGIYRGLTAGRARWARERGVKYLHSDSTSFSRPILERCGLLPITTTTPYIWTR